MLTIALLAALATPAPAQQPPAEDTPLKDQPPDPRGKQDFTAYTVREGQWRVGFNGVDYGLSDTTSVGTSAFYWVVGPSVRGKVTAIDRQRLAFAVEAGYYGVYSAWIEALVTSSSDVDFTATLGVVPLSWTGTWNISDRWSVHLGNSWKISTLEGELTGLQISEIMATVAGDDLDDAVLGELGSATVYANAMGRFTLASGQLAAEWRRNARGSLILVSDRTLWLSGLVAGTTGASGEQGETGVGVAATFEFLLENAPNATSLSWQWSWDRLNLRVGLPLSLSNPFSYTQAFQMYWLLGPKDSGKDRG
jgi:hypothetical protein